jgi:toxin CcdB
MAQFDVHPAPVQLRREFAYLVVLQSDLIERTDSVVAAPLIRVLDKQPVTRLTPVFTIDGEPLMLDVLQLATVPVRALGSPKTSLAKHRDKIIAALDLLFTGI